MRPTILTLALLAVTVGCRKEPDDTDIVTQTEDTDVEDTDVALACGDHDLVRWYADMDRDGFGSALFFADACEPPSEGYVLDATDCDDVDRTVHPNAAETCDGADNDCDGLVDDDDDSLDASGGIELFVDADADGHGDPDQAVWACASAVGTSADPTDCDDALASVHPDADEVCNNGADDDCDGTPNTCAPNGDASTADGIAWGERSGDAAGMRVGLVRDLDGDDHDDLIVAAPYWDNGSTSNAGRVYVVSGGTFSGHVEARNGRATIDGIDANGAVGTSFAVGDFDGDGFRELAVGSPGGNSSKGAIYLFSSPAGSLDETTANGVLNNGSTYQQFGSTLATLGDYDGDGDDELLVGAPLTSANGQYYNGAVYIVDQVVGTVSITGNYVARVVGIASNQNLGTAIAGGGDIIGDGAPDLLIGSPGNAEVYVFTDGLAGETTSASANATLQGWSGSWFGGSVAFLDFDGDGYDDVLVGAPSASVTQVKQGAALLFKGPLEGTLTPEDAWLVVTGALANDEIGDAVAGGDIDGDGLDDLIISSVDANGDAGAVYVVRGANVIPGTLDASLADAWTWGSASGLSYGIALGSGADVNADGYEDVVVGASAALHSGTSTGGAYLYLGGWL